MDHQPVLIDQPLARQGLGELRAAVREQVAALLRLQPRDLIGELPGRDLRLRPLGALSVFEKTTFGISFIGAA
jgi:hypothetical protein